MTRQPLTRIAAGICVGGLAILVGTFGAPSSVQAQDDGAGEQSEASEAQASDTSNDASAESSDGSSESSDKSADSDSASEEEKSAESGGSGGDASETEKKASDKGEKSKKNKKKVGPGGRELREDYPGTEASKKESMNTDRIEGLQFDEGQDPSQAYDMEIQELETKIDDLKEKVFQSKSRIVLLKETVLGGNLSGSRATIVHENRLGSQYKLTRALYSLDGSRVYNKVGKDTLAGKNELTVYDGSITTGSHNVSIVLEYKGSGYGIFNYMDGYHVRITSSCQFQAQAGKATTLTVRAVNKGGPFSSPENRPGIQCRITEAELSTNKMESLQASDGTGGEGESEGGGSGAAQSGPN